MDLSIIIVNYNVKYFLEHCLVAVQKAITSINAEVFIVDNQSSDGSKTYFENRFTDFHFIYNNENVGFAKGNNIAVAKATGKYILFLNPDTIVAEDSFEKCIAFMDAHEKAGALGVKMIDGAGNFLKESKRSFPSPITSFYKLSGLARLFPKSAIFSKYHLGNLNENETHQVDVLAGAYMMVRKSIINQIGSFDESFFMYGEDVDLSYRIQKAGFENYYFADTTIIHFKGESTKRGSLNYVRMFYKAMSQFVSKHYGQTKAGTFNLFIQLAIFIRGGLASLRRAIQWVGLPLLDAGIALLCIWAAKLFWFAKIKPDVRYVREILVSAAFTYTIVYIVVSYLTGLYDKPFRQKNLNRSAIVATVLLLALYGLLPEHYRFSRGIILLSAALLFVTLSLFRWLLVRMGVLEDYSDEEEEKQTVVVSNPLDYQEIVEIYSKANIKERILGNINTTQGKSLATYTQWEAIKKSIEFKNVIFSSNSVSYKEIIEQVQKSKNHYKTKFFHPLTFSIIGSDSKNTIGESITQHGKFNIETASAKRCKRLLDVAISTVLLIFSPILYWFLKKPKHFFNDCFSVLLSKKTFVGYCTLEENQLPYIKPAIIANNGFPHNKMQDSSLESAELLYELDYRYAKSYQCRKDLKIVFRYYLGR